MYKKQEKFLNNPEQIYRVDSKGKFIEFMAPRYNFQKVIVNIVEYGENHKKTSEASYYLDIPWTLEFCRKIQVGAIRTAVEKQRAAGSSQPVLKLQGGSSDYNTGSVTAREFTIECAKKVGNVLFKITEGPGTKTKEGLYPLDYSRVNEFKRTFVPVDYQKLYELAAIMQARLNAFIIGMQINGYYEYKPENTSSQRAPEPVPSPYSSQSTAGVVEFPQQKVQSEPAPIQRGYVQGSFTPEELMTADLPW